MFPIHRASLSTRPTVKVNSSLQSVGFVFCPALVQLSKMTQIYLNHSIEAVLGTQKSSRNPSSFYPEPQTIIPFIGKSRLSLRNILKYSLALKHSINNFIPPYRISRVQSVAE